ncbi:MAG: hypothetical protein OHK0050_13010 [Roseiflexaceae bacterium]
MSVATILVVEDEAIVAANIEMRLQSLGYQVPAVIDTGPEAIELIDTVRPDLVLMDIRIAGPIDGISTAEIIRKRHAIPVIYLTAYTDDETVARARHTEPYGYILKPFEVSELRTAIELALYRHTMERQQRAREQWFSTTLYSISDAVITTDTKGWITFSNPAAERLIGRELSAILSLPVDQVVQLTDETTNQPLSDLSRAVLDDTGPTLVTHHQALLQSSNQHIPVEYQAAPIRTSEHELLGAVIVLRDLRERRAIEARIHLIEMAVQQADEGVVILEAARPNPMIVFVNRSFSRITGYAADLALGQTLTQLLQSDQHPGLLDQLQIAFSTTRPFFHEGLIPHRHGHTIQIEWNLTPMRASNGIATHWVGVIRDVTRRRRDQELRWQRQKLESLGVLAGGIAHDFNNLLAVILGNASMAQMELPSDSPVRELIGPIESAARRAAELTRQMLAYAGHDRTSMQSLDLNMAVHEVYTSLAPALPTRIKCVLDLDFNLPPVIADITQIRRVLRNLITNAHEAIGDSIGTITIQTTTQMLDRAAISATYLSPSLPTGEYVALSIHDTGLGMDPEVLSRAFEPFFTTKFAGRGLGLAEVLGIISAHQGTLQIESAPNQGTTCTILLPALDMNTLLAEQQSLANFSALPLPNTRHDGSRGLLLVVEYDSATPATNILKHANFAVLHAANSQIANDLFRAYASVIDAVILATPPDEHGDWGAKQINTIRANTPLITIDQQQITLTNLIESVIATIHPN